MIPAVSNQGSMTSIPMSSQAPEPKGNFMALLTAVRRGEAVSNAQIDLWEAHKMATGQLGGEPDEVEMAGMVRGFRMEFPEGFPADLRERLESMWGDCKTPSARYTFVNMYAGTFSAYNVGPRWDSDWRQRLKYTLSANEQLAQGLDSFSARGTREIDELLRRVLGPE